MLATLAHTAGKPSTIVILLVGGGGASLAVLARRLGKRRAERAIGRVRDESPLVNPNTITREQRAGNQPARGIRDYLLMLRHRPGNGFLLLSVVCFLLAGLSTEGLETQLITLAGSIVVIGPLGYLWWRWWEARQQR